MRRKRLSRRSSKKIWKRGVRRVHSKNKVSSHMGRRGGIRL